MIPGNAFMQVALIGSNEIRESCRRTTYISDGTTTETVKCFAELANVRKSDAAEVHNENEPLWPL